MRVGRGPSEAPGEGSSQGLTGTDWMPSQIKKSLLAIDLKARSLQASPGKGQVRHGHG